MEIGQSLRSYTRYWRKLFSSQPWTLFTSAVLRACSGAPFGSAVNLLSRQFGHLTELGVWHENFVGIAINMFILVVRCSLPVAMEVLATSTVASLFTVMCSCLQSLPGPNAWEHFGHLHQSPVAKGGVVGGTVDMCFCDVDECRTSRVPMCPCRDLLVSVRPVCRTGARDVCSANRVFCVYGYCCLPQSRELVTCMVHPFFTPQNICSRLCDQVLCNHSQYVRNAAKFTRGVH